MRASRNIARALMPKTASLEQAGGLHRMVLRGHTGPVGKVLLTPGGTDVVTGTMSLHTLYILVLYTYLVCLVKVCVPYVPGLHDTQLKKE